MKILFIAYLSIIFALSSYVVAAADRVTGETFAGRSPVLATQAMAATSQPLATQAALDVMQKGGNAIDAAIAANAVLGLVEPTGNGIGGDLYAIVWDAKEQKLHGLNASGRSPLSLTREYFLDNNLSSIPSHGPLPVSVPGAVDGWFMLHERFGKLSMQENLQPAIDYAENGFPVTQLIAYYWNRSVPILEKWPGFTEQFTVDGKGRAPREGEIWRNPNLANTLRIIAADGRDAFYQGELAKVMADYMQANGGFLSLEDLASHTSNWVDPVSTNYRGYDVWELPPNGQGIAALQILNILELYDVAEMGRESAEYIHLFTEAKKLVFEDRAKYYADSQFNKIPVQELISKKYARKRAKLIDLEKAGKEFPAGVLQDGDTIYLTTADPEGNMVSLIQSNYRGMGSGMAPPGLGFIFQDRGEMFSLEEGHFNVFEPGKRPFHTIIPAFITKDGKPWMSFGLMGGAMQPQGHAQIVVNMVDFGLDVQAAGDAPRIHHTGSSEPTGESMTDGGILNLETGFPYATIRQLMRMGHKVQFANGPYGGYQAILRAENGVYWGATESRKDGHAAGY